MSFWDKFDQNLLKDFRAFPDTYLTTGSFMQAFSGMHVSNLINATKDDPWIDTVADPFIGGPKLHGKVSQSTMRAILYIREIEQHFDPQVIKWVTDFGPGYGNFIRVWHKLFNCQFYQLVDIESLHQVHQSYLGKLGIHANWRTYDSQLKPGGQSGPSLFFASHSLNECAMDIRDTVEKYLPNYDYLFISYNEDFEGNDNVAYFKALGDRLTKHFTITHTFDKITGKRRLIGVK